MQVEITCFENLPTWRCFKTINLVSAVLPSRIFLLSCTLDLNMILDYHIYIYLYSTLDLFANLFHTVPRQESLKCK